MEVIRMEDATNSFMEPDIGSSSESFLRFLESQKELFHSQIDQLQKIVVTQCKLTGVNPLSQEMAAGALSIKIGKRPRDLLNPKAVKYMQSVFSIKDTISKKETREISALCGVTATQVRDFFAGQRSRVRRLVRLSREKEIGFNTFEPPTDGNKACLDGNKAPPDGNEAPPDGIEAPVVGTKAPLDGHIIDSGHAMPVSNPVPLNSVDPRNAEGGPSCSSQDENIPGIDNSDKEFLQNILKLMGKEETFSGQIKLMEWVLQIHNLAVLQWFLTKGGMMILATWLSLAALEEQTTVILIIFKVLCHLPLHKALPVHISAILQTVNRLRFYRTSDISNRARVLLSRWSKLFVRSQALKKPSPVNPTNDSHKEMIRKQRISEILSDESWQLKIDIPEDILALSNENSENLRKEPRQKMLTASGENSNKKHMLSGSPSQTRERRKVLLVEQPGRRTAGRSVQVARAVPANQSRPMSADDIQKAKMRAIFMQSKYGKLGTSPNGSCQEKTDNQKLPIPQTSDNQKMPSIAPTVENQETPTMPLPQSSDNQKTPSIAWTDENQETPTIPHTSNALSVSGTLQLKQGEDRQETVPPSKTSHALPGALTDSMQPMVPPEPIWEKLKRDQIQWQTPPEMRINGLWSVGAGEKSKEVEVQAERIRREKRTFYHSTRDIPLDPKEPWDIEMDSDDTLTPDIPTEQPPDVDGAEASSPRNVDNVGEVSMVTSAPVSNGNPEPDMELLAVLLKNPDLVFALTSGQGNSFTSAETVALLDMLKRSNISLPGVLRGLEGNAVEEKPEITSLPSPTPPAERAMRWRSEPAPTRQVPTFPQLVLPAPIFLPPFPTQASSLLVHQIPTTSRGMPQPTVPDVSHLPEKPLLSGPTAQHINLTTMIASSPTMLNAATALLQKQPPIVVPVLDQVQLTTTVQRIRVPEAILPANHMPLASTTQQSIPVAGPSMQQSPMAQVELPNYGRMYNQKPPPPPASMLTNSLNNRPSMQPPPAASPPVYPCWPSNAAGDRRQHVPLDSSISDSRPRGFLDSRSSVEHFQSNLNNSDSFRAGHAQAPLRPGPSVNRNELMGEPEFETWSPEGSPVRSPSRELRYERNFNGPRRDFGRTNRHELPRHRNSGRRDHRSGNRRWRDRDRRH